jgi:hypothetical protein
MASRHADHSKQIQDKHARKHTDPGRDAAWSAAPGWVHKNIAMVAAAGNTLACSGCTALSSLAASSEVTRGASQLSASTGRCLQSRQNREAGKSG